MLKINYIFKISKNIKIAKINCKKYLKKKKSKILNDLL